MTTSGSKARHRAFVVGTTLFIPWVFLEIGGHEEHLVLSLLYSLRQVQLMELRVWPRVEVGWRWGVC
jgi:hypothetical protein